ncbi:MAG TPA: hypothetical protein VGH11_00745 [Jatrophihabitans sp.]
MLRNNTLILALVASIALIGAIVLAALHDPIPEFVPSIALALIGALAGVVIPQATIVTQASQPEKPAPSDPTPPATTAAAPVTLVAVPPVLPAA